ncbi:MAG: hypothetical protein K5786_04250 [Treponema sp.]|nr:hypothetical protein [Treponema sp.]
MKRLASIIGCLVLTFYVTSCAMEIPEKVSVKTNAEYNFSLGNFEKDLNSEINISAMLGEDGDENARVTRYDYFPGKEDKNVQQFLVEIKIMDLELLSAENVEAVFGSAESKTALELAIPGTLTDKIGLDFSPSDIMEGLGDAVGSDLVGKISFSEVPMYLYFDATGGLSANASFDMFYGSRTTPIVERSSTRTSMYNDSVTKSSKPEYSYQDNTIIITDLEKKSSSVKLDITNLLNNHDSHIESEDQLCVEYTLSSITGTISKAAAQNGVKISLYAIVVLPMQFKVLDDVKLNLNDMAGSLTGDENATEASSASENEASSTSSNDELSKYLNVIESVSIKYVAYKLPLYVSRRGGLKLGVDMVGRGNYEYANIYTVKEGTEISDSDKCSIDLKQSTIQKIKDLGSFIPNFQLMMEKDIVFSLPRDKGVKVNLELSLKTDGEVEVN